MHTRHDASRSLRTGRLEWETASRTMTGEGAGTGVVQWTDERISACSTPEEVGRERRTASLTVTVGGTEMVQGTDESISPSSLFVKIPHTLLPAEAPPTWKWNEHGNRTLPHPDIEHMAIGGL